MGAKISTFFYCLGTDKQGEPNAPLNAVGILPALTPEFIPSAFSFAIVLVLVGVNDEKVHTMDIVFKDNHGKPLVEAKSIGIPSNNDTANNVPPEARGLTLGMDLKNVILKEDGMYSTSVSFDGVHLGEYEIYVKGKQ